jgi:hypothetical protein
MIRRGPRHVGTGIVVAGSLLAIVEGLRLGLGA